MTAAPTPAAADTNRPDPHQDRPAPNAVSPRNTGLLRSIVHKLIDYGRQLVSALRQPIPPANLHDIQRDFRTIDIAQIIQRIMRGLLRADALEARLAHRRNPPPATDETRAAPSPREPRAARPARHRTIAADPSLAGLPSADDIAAQIRRRPVGAVIADICRDLCIPMNHKLWRELTIAIIANGGKWAALVDERLKQLGTFRLDLSDAELFADLPPYLQQFVLTHSTGPP